MNKLFLYILFSLVFVKMFPQYGITNLQANKNGLPSSNVYSSILDSKGNFWFCTNKGLSKYNSVTFENYDISIGLPDNDVLSVFEDNDGRIWLHNLNNEVAYIKNNIIYKSENDKSLKNLSEVINKNKFFIRYMFQPYNDTIYLFTNSNVYYKYLHDGFSVEQTIKTKKLNIHYLFINNKKLYAITNKGIIDFYTESLVFKFDYDPIANINHFNTINGKTYFFYRNIIYKLNGLKIEPHLKLNENIVISSLEFLNSNEILYCHSDSIFKYTFSDNKTNFINGMSNLNINGITKDSENNIWVNSLNFGVFLLANNTLDFKTESIGKNITSFVIHNSELYYGDLNGLIYKQNLSTKKIELLYNPNPKNSIISIHNIKSLVVNKNEILTIGYENSIINYNLNNNTTEKILVNVKNIELDSKKEAWVTSYYGVAKIETLKNNYTIAFDFFKNEIFKKYRFYGFCDDSVNQKFYMSHDNIFLTYKDHLIKQDTLNSRISLIKTKNNILFWILNQDNGLWIYDTKTFINVPVLNLEGNPTTCNDIYLENDSTVWACNTNQFFKIEISVKSRRIKSQKSYDLANNTNINRILSYNNIVYLATEIGLLKIEEKKLKVDKYNTPITISKIKINDKIIENKQRYYLNYFENNIVINYNATYFQKFGDVNYRYKFIGNDTNWHYTKSSTLEFPNLSPGNYHFIINANDKYGYWSNKYEDLYFNIKPPFYKTTWFIISFFLIFIALIYFITNSILQRNNKKREIELKLQKSLLLEKENALNFKQKQQDAEQKLYSAQVNPHFIFNALNSIQGFILKSNPKEAYNYIEIFSSLIRSVLVNSKTESISVLEDIENLKKYLTLEKLRFAEKLTYELRFESEIPDNINMPSMLLQPYVENAIWHGLMTKKTNGLLKIVYKIKENYIFISIIDNGIGRKLAATFPKNNKGTGTGLKLCEERLRLYSEKIKKPYSIEIIDLFENEIASGTQINLKIPLI